jgi:hypothetical protein
VQFDELHRRRIQVKARIQRNGDQQAGDSAEQGEHPCEGRIAIGTGRQDCKTGKDRYPDGKREKRRG